MARVGGRFRIRPGASPGCCRRARKTRPRRRSRKRSDEEEVVGPMEDTLAMLTRCVRHQGESEVSPEPSGADSVSVETHACVPYAPTTHAPNLLLWTGGRHALVLDLKDADIDADAPAVS